MKNTDVSMVQRIVLHSNVLFCVLCLWKPFTCVEANYSQIFCWITSRDNKIFNSSIMWWKVQNLDIVSTIGQYTYLFESTKYFWTDRISNHFFKSLLVVVSKKFRIFETHYTRYTIEVVRQIISIRAVKLKQSETVESKLTSLFENSICSALTYSTRS